MPALQNGKLKVLQINKFPSVVGGTEIVLFDTIDLLKKVGHEVVLFSTDEGEISYQPNYRIHYPAKKDSLRKKLPYIFSFFYNRKAVRVLERIIDKEKPDIAHVHLYLNSLSQAILSVLKKRNISVVMTLHEYRQICPSYLLLDRKQNICERCMGGKYYQCLFTRCAKGGLLESLILTAEMYFRRVFCPTEKYVDKFICVSQFVYGKYRQFNSRISAKAVVLHNPVRIPSGHNNNNRGSYLLFIGRLSRERGIETLMNVMKELPHISLKVAGTGDYPKDNIPFNVEFLGFKRHEEVERLIEGARYLLFPSEWYEPFGLSIAECLSLGKPVIASRIGAIPELVEDGKNGFLFEVKDTEGLIGIVRKAWPLADSEYAAMSRYAADSMKKYSSAIYSNKLLTLYHELLGNIEDEDSHSGDKRNSG